MMRCLTAVLLASLLVGSGAGAQNGVNPGLKRVRRITILIDPLEADAIRIGFDTAAIRRQVETALGEQRIAATPMVDSSDGFLYVGLDAVSLAGSDVSAATIDIEFWAPATLDPPLHGTLTATAWSTRAIFIAVNSAWPSKIHAEMAAQLEKFMDSWRDANPPVYER